MELIPSAAPAVECAGLSVSYGSHQVLHQIDLAVGAGEVLAVLGPSGSGKSTLLQAVAGFIAPAAGELRIGGRVVADERIWIPPEGRSVGMVFQSFALWPHLTILDNVAYPARRRGLPVAAARAEAAELLGRLGLGELLARRPAELSGGEQQRVGLARALARRPGLFLFDEPTSQLDTALRASMQQELDDRRRELGAAAIFATHDFEEALAIADTVALLRQGRVVQLGSPADVYERPADLWSARLTGPASMIEGRVLENGRAEVAGVTLTGNGRGEPVTAPGPARLLVRPDWARIGGQLPAVVTGSFYRGAHTDYHLDTPAGSIELRQLGPPTLRPGEPITWSLDRFWPLAQS
ncbi:MAG: ABC transporter ATP-binding protein [Candidatus Dormibacteraceae bacterium]